MLCDHEEASKEADNSLDSKKKWTIEEYYPGPGGAPGAALTGRKHSAASVYSSKARAPSSKQCNTLRATLHTKLSLFWTAAVELTP